MHTFGDSHSFNGRVGEPYPKKDNWMNLLAK